MPRITIHDRHCPHLGAQRMFPSHTFTTNRNQSDNPSYSRVVTCSCAMRTENMVGTPSFSACFVTKLANISSSHVNFLQKNQFHRLRVKLIEAVPSPVARQRPLILTSLGPGFGVQPLLRSNLAATPFQLGLKDPHHFQANERTKIHFGGSQE